jgi:hypothetical protein
MATLKEKFGKFELGKEQVKRGEMEIRPKSDGWLIVMVNCMPQIPKKN